MKYCKTSLIFLTAIILLIGFSCKANNENKTSDKSQDKGKAVKTSKSAINVANDFVKAGMNGDFKRLAELSCKNDGLYTSFEDVKNLDLGNIGYIEEIIREEKSEADPDNLTLAVVRAKVLGEIGFFCFYVFKTSAGYKIYLQGNYLWAYPPEKEELARMALGFYFSNKIKFKEAITLAEYLISKNATDLQIHYMLAAIYIMNNQKPKAISEMKTLVNLDNDYKYILLIEKDYLVATAKEMFGEESTNSKRKALDLINKASLVLADDSIIPLLEEAILYEDFQVRRMALRSIDKLPDMEKRIPFFKTLIKDENQVVRWNTIASLDRVDNDSKIPLLEEALQDKDIGVKEKTARILNRIGNDKGRKVLIDILSTRLRTIINKSRDNKWELGKGVPIIKELGSLRDIRAVPVLIETRLYARFTQAYSPNLIKSALLKIGKPAITYLEEVLSNEKKYIDEGVGIQCFHSVSGWSFETILRELKKK